MTSNPVAPAVSEVKDDMLDRYERARRFLYGVDEKVALNADLVPHWIDQYHFWYVRETKEGNDFRLVNAKQENNAPLFQQNVLANKLVKATGQQVEANNLPITLTSVKLSPFIFEFIAFDKSWEFNDESGALEEVERIPLAWVVSPDGNQAAFSRDYNLWIKNLKNGVERQLTFDGEEFYRYGVPASIYGNNVYYAFLELQALWSPDSKRIFIVQNDQRRVQSIGVIQHVPLDGSLRPQTDFRKLAMQGDEHVEAYRLLAIDVDNGEQIEANYSKVHQIQAASGGFFENSLGWWNIDNRRAYFVDVDRYYKSVRVVEFDTFTGATQVLFEEVSKTRIDMTMDPFGLARLRPLPETNELLWYSDRSGWAHYYLYDLDSGRLKNPVTSGDWLVRDFLHFDAERREVFLSTAGRVKDRDPYYRDLVRVNIDTSVITTLVSSEHEYSCGVINLEGFPKIISGVSPSGDYAVVTRCRADQASESFLLGREGNIILDLEKATLSLPEGWQWPESIKLTAADGDTDIYGLIFRPSDFSPEKSYPLVDWSLVGYEIPVVTKSSFRKKDWYYFRAAALAELGFIVVQIDGRGTRYRGKAFYDQSYGWRDSISHIDDHVAAIEQIGERYSYIDMDRIGVDGIRWGGNSAVVSLLQYPDFFKVGVAGQLYDTRLCASHMSDEAEGESPSPERIILEDMAENLQGKLLLMHGLLDYMPPAITFRLVEALQRANKDFELIIEPNGGYGVTTYQQLRGWNFLVKHLLNIEPPKDFILGPDHPGCRYF